MVFIKAYLDILSPEVVVDILLNEIHNGFHCKEFHTAVYIPALLECTWCRCTWYIGWDRFVDFGMLRDVTLLHS